MYYYPRNFSLGYILFNAISYGIAAGLAIAGSVILIINTALFSDSWAVVSACVYGFTLITTYTLSTLYVAINDRKGRKVFRVLSNDSIFLLVIGTVTPFALVTLRGTFGWVLLGIVLVLCVVDIIFASISLEKFHVVIFVGYLVAGWAIIFAIGPLISQLPVLSLVFLLSGGILYTLGAIFYKWDKFEHFHMGWNLFIIAGSILHYFSIFLAIGTFS